MLLVMKSCSRNNVRVSNQSMAALANAYRLKFSMLALALLVCLFCSVAAKAQVQNFSNFIAFGDSLSDTGNLASSLPINLPFPFFDNRISDGPVAIDYLSAAIGFDARASEVGGFNFAVAGGNIVGLQREDLTAQVSSYLARTNGVADSNALYFVMLGGNDLRRLRSQTDVSIAQSEIDAIVEQLLVQLTRLRSAGATHFFVSNVPNVGRIPETLQRETVDAGIAARAEQYTRDFNQLLNQKLLQFTQQNSANVIEYDLFTKIELILDSPADFGFLISLEGCFDIGEIENVGDLFEIADAFHPLCEVGTRFDRFVFFDKLHPASGVNQIVGESMIQALSAAPPVTEPPAYLSALYLLLLD